MNKKKYIILVIALQIAVLMSFIVRYEILKATGTTVYVRLRGYDPTDIFRGDYVNLAYEFPYSGTRNIYGMRYLTPEIDDDRVTGIQDLSREEPKEGVFFQISSISPTMTRDIILSVSTGELTYTDRSCGQTYGEQYGIGESITYEQYGMSPVSSIYKGSDKSINQDGKIATIKSITPCVGTARIRTTATDRWFVPDGTGLDLEKRIRE